MSSPNSPLPGVNVLLEGPTGTGKTHSIGTLVESGIECFYLAMEPGMESLLGYWQDKGKPIPENLHWHYIAQSNVSFKTMIDAAKKINSYTHEALAKMQDPDRHKHNDYITLLETLADFKDDRTGQSFGAVDSWGTDRCLIIDPLTTINMAAMSLVIGSKPVKSQSDWGIAQDQVERLLRALTHNTRCHFVLIAHVEREVDQILSTTKITVGTLGKALAPKIPPMFSDVIYTSREGTNFYWSTINTQVDLKTRNLPLMDKIKPDFRQIIAKWKQRGGQA